EAASATEDTAPPRPEGIITCGNCERAIGKMEPAHHLSGTWVCDECRGRLVRPANLPSARAGRPERLDLPRRAEDPVEKNTGIRLALLLLGLLFPPLLLAWLILGIVDYSRRR